MYTYGLEVTKTTVRIVIKYNALSKSMTPVSLACVNYTFLRKGSPLTRQSSFVSIVRKRIAIQSRLSNDEKIYYFEIARIISLVFRDFIANSRFSILAMQLINTR